MSPAAALRNPQVPVAGGALQAYMNSLGESFDVQHAQLAGSWIASTVPLTISFTLQVEFEAKSPGLVFGVYDGTGANPALVRVFPAAATAGWFATVSFRENPTRTVVSNFDAQGAFLGTTVTLGGNRNAIGFYVTGPNGTVFSEDVRNAGSSAQALLYAGTGINSGSLWMAWEDELPSPTANRDFMDAILFFETVGSPVFAVPVQSTSWARLKERFR